jgi:dimethylaniline monooxygenase (N-oxide forming)
MEANAVIRSDFIENVNTGRITPHRASIEKFTETGICLSNGEILEVDAVILCTGYRNKFPVVPDDSYRAATGSVNSLQLYRMTASPEYSNLFFMGILELVGPIHPTLELQARWATAVLAKRISLPPKEAMFTAIAKLSKEQSRHVSFFFLCP